MTHVGLMVANCGRFAEPEHARVVATIAESVGMESLWTAEHVVMVVDDASPYPYSSKGMPGAEDAVIADPLVWLTFAAAVTSTIKLGTGILILPQRQPVVLAKATATLDRLSQGRLLLGVGAGWSREEAEACGAPFDRRAERLEEFVEVLRELWTADEASYIGKDVAFERAKLNPKPHAGPVPILIGGHAPAAARRAGRIGDGWFPISADSEQLAGLVDVMHRSAEASGRDPDAIEITYRAPYDLREAERVVALGVDRLIVPSRARSDGELADELAGFVSTYADLGPS